jgi:hypothetical protein
LAELLARFPLAFSSFSSSPVDSFPLAGGPQYFSVAAHYVFRGGGDFEPRWTQGAAGGGQGAIVVTFLV